MPDRSDRCRIASPPSGSLRLSGATWRVDNASQAAIRKRRERTRSALGIEVFEVELPRDKFLAELIDRGRLTPAETLDKARVELEIGKIVAEWAANGLKEQMSRRDRQSPGPGRSFPRHDTNSK